MIKQLLSIILILIAGALNAQDHVPEMADAMRENGKINVVIGVLLIVFLSIAVYLALLERRLKRLEEKNRENA